MEICSGKINMLGFCDRCGQISENTSTHCGRIIEPMPASSGTTIIGLGDSYSVIQYGVNEPVKLTRKQYFKKLKAYIKSLVSMGYKVSHTPFKD